MMYELKPMKDSRKSFYQKAIVIEEAGTKKLLSYMEEVLTISDDGEVKFGSLWDCSPTTLRHVKEALYQWIGFEGTKKDIINRFGL